LLHYGFKQLNESQSLGSSGQVNDLLAKVKAWFKNNF
jgi:hypothetical protein